MVYIQDLSPYSDFGADLIAIGWLEPGQPFCRGPVPEPFLKDLTALLNFPWAPFAAAGPHRCGLCPNNGPHGCSDLLVPSSEGVYICPEMILHYILEHDYQPPTAFQNAVTACPPTWTDAYFDALDSGLVAVWESFCGLELRAYHRKDSETYRQSLASARTR